MATKAEEATTTTDQWPVLPRDTDIAVKCAVLETPTSDIEKQLLEFFPKGILDDDGKPVLPAVRDDETAAKVADYLTFARKFLQSVDKRRLAYTKPARDFQTDLNNEVGRYTNRVNAAVAEAGRYLLAYETRKREAAAKAERDAREAREKEALEQAQKLEEAGNTAAAQRVVEVAASAPRRSEIRPTETRGMMTGRRVGIRKTWKGDLVDLKVLLQAVIDGKLSSDGIDISQAFLNRVAAAHAKTETVYGVKCYEHESLS